MVALLAEDAVEVVGEVEPMLALQVAVESVAEIRLKEFQVSKIDLALIQPLLTLQMTLLKQLRKLKSPRNHLTK